MTDRTLSEFEKNAGEVLRVKATEYRGHQLIDVRIWSKMDDRPTKKGLSLKRSMLPDLIAALEEAQRTLPDD